MGQAAEELSLSSIIEGEDPLSIHFQHDSCSDIAPIHQIFVGRSHPLRLCPEAVLTVSPSLTYAIHINSMALAIHLEEGGLLALILAPADVYPMVGDQPAVTTEGHGSAVASSVFVSMRRIRHQFAFPPLKWEPSKKFFPLVS